MCVPTFEQIDSAMREAIKKERIVGRGGASAVIDSVVRVVGEYRPSVPTPRKAKKRRGVGSGT